MTLMVAEVLRLPALGKAFSQSAFWSFIAFNTSHVEWQGGSLHDLIQPGFSFLVGASLPFSIASRQGAGARAPGAWSRTPSGARSLLVFLGIFLRSISTPQTYFTFEDTLTQIGLGYVVPVPARAWRARACRWRRWCVDPRRILGGVCALSRARPAVRLPSRGRAARLAASLQRLPLALGQELQPRLGLRHAGSSTSSRASGRSSSTAAATPRSASSRRSAP